MVQPKPVYTEQQVTNYAKWHHVPIQEVPPTQMEIGQTPAEATPQPTQNEVPDEEMPAATKEQNPLRQRKQINAAPKASAAKKTKVKEQKGPNNTLIWNLHGGGECGARDLQSKNGRPGHKELKDHRACRDEH